MENHTALDEQVNCIIFFLFSNFFYEWEWTAETMANEPHHYEKVNLIIFFVSISFFVLHIERK